MVYLSPLLGQCKREDVYLIHKLVYFISELKTYIHSSLWTDGNIALVKCPICKVGNIVANSEFELCPMCETTVKEYIMAIYELASDKNNGGVPLEDVESLVNKRQRKVQVNIVILIS